MSQASTPRVTPKPTGAGASTPAQGSHNQESDDQYREGPVARSIEKKTGQIPSDAFLWTAGAAALGSAVLMASGRKNCALFVGQWVSGILICGLYNKIVKTTGHDRTT